jgi:hypothetical protein
MKTTILKYSFSLLIAALIFNACNDSWDEHYNQDEQIVNNDNIEVVKMSVVDFLKSKSNFSSFYKLFEDEGLINDIKEKNLLYTLLIVDNSSMTGNPPSDDTEYLAKSHISDISLSPSNLYDGQRILMWNGKYLNVSKVENENKEFTISFNGAKVKKITKVNDGYIYEIEDFVDSPKSMFELIKDLNEDYSIFRDMILSRNQLTFDREASLPIGVDNTGSTVYDSVFIVTNPYFDAINFDLNSESLTATMLIFPNDVVEKALTEAVKNLASWGLQREDSVLSNWILEAAFYNQRLTKQDFDENIDLSSIFKRQWRTTVQNVDLDNPVSMSNGVAYIVTEFKIPTNVLIYRVKDYMKWYEFLSDTEKSLYFDADNLTYDKCNTDVGEWSGWPGVFPNITNRVLMYNLTDKERKEYTLNFTGIQYSEATQTAKPYLIPPGEYDLCLGFKQKLGHDVDISFNGEFVGTVTASQLTSTTFHYDRGGQGYPEGYSTSLATNSKKGNYDRDGGKVGTVIIEGNEPVEVKITFQGLNVGNGKTLFHHWTLKPTNNCY